ncbi:MAG: glycosyltransferase family 2 protein [Saprospiraceae bacterium]|nr:glycosyltransferase family 2 protein [Saprospiraceae bacterium]
MKQEQAYKAPLVSVVAVNYRQAELTFEFLDSLKKINYSPVEVWLVDNGCLEDRSEAFRSHYEGIEVLISTENLGFAGGNNLAIRKAKGQYVLLINNDTLVPPDFLGPMVRLMEENEKIGIVSPKIYYADAPKILQYAGINGIDRFTGRGLNRAKQKPDNGSFDDTGQTYFAHGACMLVRAEVFQQAGELSEDYFLYYEELDFCEAVRAAGWEIFYTAESHIYHRESSSIGKSSPLKTYYMFRNRWLFMRNWYSGFSYYLFVLYFLSVGVPWHLLKHWRKGEKEHVQAILKGVKWHFRAKKIKVDEGFA